MAIRSTTIDGLDELIKAFAKLGIESLPYLQTGANEAAEVVLANTKAKAPVLSGNLKASLKLVKAKVSAKYPYRVFSKVSFTPRAHYGVFVELGHKLVRNKTVYGKVDEHPFMRPAADESKSEVVDIITKHLNKALDEMGGRR